jgi:hypothetical protein
VQRAVLPMSISAGASISVGGVMLPIVGAVAGALLLGLPGALIGGGLGLLMARA